MDKKKRVVIIGGGISGLTVAHELSMLGGFTIEVYERHSIMGGKARSYRDDNGNPGEHSLRGYFQPYNCLFHTMKEIPFGDGTVYDNLVYSDMYFSYGGKRVLLSPKDPSSWVKFKAVLGFVRFIHKGGVPLHEIVYYGYKISRWLWMGKLRLQDTMEYLSYEDYLHHDQRSEAFRRTLVRLPDILTAAKPYAAATEIIEMLLSIGLANLAKTDHKRTGTSIMNGPTNERFIDPWVELLKNRGVKFHPDSRASRLVTRGDRLLGVEINEEMTVLADVLVMTVQHNMLSALIPQILRRRTPSLHQLNSLGDEWSNGAQYFLSDLPEEWESFVGNATMVQDAPWSLVYTVQANGDPGWSNVIFPEGTKAVLTVVYSNATEPGVLFGKPVKRCTEEQILEECLAQLKFDDKKPIIRGSMVSRDIVQITAEEYEEHEARYAGLDVSWISREEGLLTNDAPLYISLPGNSLIEPLNTTALPKLFLAGEYTKTRTPVPTMESANESGKRCAEAICEKFGLEYDSSRYDTVRIPLKWLRDFDDFWYRGWRKIPKLIRYLLAFGLGLGAAYLVLR